MSVSALQELRVWVQKNTADAPCGAGAAAFTFVFTRELASLHGLSDVPRHAELLDTAFDEAEEIALDAIDQARSSLSL